MKHAFEKDVILRRPRRGLYSPIARFPGAEAPGWPYVAPVGGFIHQTYLWVMTTAWTTWNTIVAFLAMPR